LGGKFSGSRGGGDRAVWGLMVGCGDLPTRTLRILSLRRATPVLSPFSRRGTRRAGAAPRRGIFWVALAGILVRVGVDPGLDGGEYSVHVLFDIGIGEAQESYT
jgi:hypothetical protein